MKMWSARISRALRIVVLAIVLLLPIGYVYERIAESRDRERYPPPGRLIAVSEPDVGGRKLHLNCRGTGSPTVIVETGSGVPSFHWWSIQNQLAKILHVCTYDRAGYGWSDPAPRGRSIEDRAKDLHRLLHNAQVAGPYVLVGHSYGGFIVRLFARDFPNEVTGVVLVDAAEEGVVFTPEFQANLKQSIPGRKILQQATRFGISRVVVSLESRETAVKALKMPTDVIDTVGLTVAGISPAFMEAFVDEAASMANTPVEMRKPGGFGALADLPLRVIESSVPTPGVTLSMAGGWHDGQVRLSRLSTQGKLIAAHESGHNIYLDEPNVVIDAIKSVVNHPANSSEASSSPP